MTLTTFSSRRRIAAAHRFPCFASVLLLLGGCGGGQEAGSAAPPVVLGAADVAVAAVADIGPSVVISGALDPADVVRVRAQVGGTIRDVRVDRGARVTKGQVLARIEAQGVTSGAESAKAGVAAAEAGLAVAQQRLDGAKKLFAAGAMAAVDMKAAQAGYDAAVAQLAAAKAGLAGASEAAERTLLRAPFDGWVSERVAEAGESIRGDDPAFTVVDPRTLELKGQVGATDAAKVRVGQVVVLTIDASPEHPYRGTVARIDPVANAATRQVGVYVRLPNGDGRVVAGQFAHGRIRTAAPAKVIAIPVTALRGDAGQPFVLVIDGGAVHRRPVVTGTRDDDAGLVSIASGLKAGERLLVSAGIELADGTKVSTPKEK
jgi:RND family efflux transporter MFP subunit